METILMMTLLLVVVGTVGSVLITEAMHKREEKKKND